MIDTNLLPHTFNDLLPSDLYTLLVADLEENGWFFDNISNGYDDNKSWTQKKQDRPILEKASAIIKDKIEKHFNVEGQYKHIKTHLNGQTYSQEGFKHKDYKQEGFITIIFYVNTFWDLHWGGETYLIKPDSTMVINQFIPNSGFLIPSNWDHWGAAPKITGLLRQTVAFSYTTEAIYSSLANTRHLRYEKRNDG